MFQNLLNSMFEIFKVVFDTALLKNFEQSNKNRRFRDKKNNTDRHGRFGPWTELGKNLTIIYGPRTRCSDRISSYFYPIRRTISLHFRVYNGLLNK